MMSSLYYHALNNETKYIHCNDIVEKNNVEHTHSIQKSTGV